MCAVTVKKGKPELRKKMLKGVVIRQKKAWRRKEGTFLYFEDAPATATFYGFPGLFWEDLGAPTEREHVRAFAVFMFAVCMFDVEFFFVDFVDFVDLEDFEDFDSFDDFESCHAPNCANMFAVRAFAVRTREHGAAS